MVDLGSTGVVDETHTIFTGSDIPCGVTVFEGNLYIAERMTIYKCTDAHNHILTSVSISLQCDSWYDFWTILDGQHNHHGWKYIEMKPNNR
eukprot:UN15713